MKKSITQIKNFSIAIIILVFVTLTTVAAFSYVDSYQKKFNDLEKKHWSDQEYCQPLCYKINGTFVLYHQGGLFSSGYCVCQNDKGVWNI